ncbi:hypothetical protein [Candidatus Marimicrobium litorale]|uniref:Uncharacterized protein n=1 Tax=Candidatus Marimicrobium litorale TaxID=2518991 RepID=A0ABT3T1V6_9GAMM|nr:hypothetical protein [Candidatus Marimicrobium litorale]MCX2976238.1 hypothetical protein [Candidatus Marimicrobium litorale]
MTSHICPAGRFIPADTVVTPPSTAFLMRKVLELAPTLSDTMVAQSKFLVSRFTFSFFKDQETELIPSPFALLVY